MTIGRCGFVCGLCAALGTAFDPLGIAAQTAPPAPTLHPGFVPNPASMEAGLWITMAKAEAQMRDAPERLRDPGVNAYLDGICRNLAGPYAGDLRLYLTRVPHFNATMAPNGMMNVWSGLLLRCENEAQLSAIIGHEIGHYVMQHSLQRIQDAKDKSNLLAFFTIGLAFARIQAGALMADAANLAVLASIFAFSRENEREADHYGLHAMARSGYHPVEASKTWANLIEEIGAEKVRERSGFIFATHPSPDERIETLSNLAKSYVNSENDGKTYDARYKERLKPLWRMLLSDETRRRSYDESFRLFDRLIKRDPDDGLLQFYRGEMHRQRSKDGDLDSALDAYDAAVKTKTEPAEIDRSIGLVHLRKGNTNKAHEHFRIYLARNPAADDRAMIESYLPKE